jgi:hypothetical protein
VKRKGFVARRGLKETGAKPLSDAQEPDNEACRAPASRCGCNADSARSDKTLRNVRCLTKDSSEGGRRVDVDPWTTTLITTLALVSLIAISTVLTDSEPGSSAGGFATVHIAKAQAAAANGRADLRTIPGVPGLFRCDVIEGAK